MVITKNIYIQQNLIEVFFKSAYQSQGVQKHAFFSFCSIKLETYQEGSYEPKIF